MIQINNPALLRSLVAEHDLRRMFSIDLTQYATIAQYDANEVICRAGERPRSIILLLEGELIASFVTKGGQEHCELHYHSPNILGLVGAMWHQPAINDVKTMCPCLCIVLPIDKCEEALRQDTVFLNYACKYLADHIRTISSRFDPLPTRLARFILNESKNGMFSYNLTVCSEILGTSQRHLFRVMRDFCEQGILCRKTRGTYEILDPELLMQQ